LEEELLGTKPLVEVEGPLKDVEAEVEEFRAEGEEKRDEALRMSSKPDLFSYISRWISKRKERRLTR
jgi:hypothetical protein